MKQEEERKNRKQTRARTNRCLACGVEKVIEDFPLSRSRTRRNVCLACLMPMAHQDDMRFVEAYLKRRTPIVITDIVDDDERRLCLKRTLPRRKEMMVPFP